VNLSAVPARGIAPGGWLSLLLRHEVSILGHEVSILKHEVSRRGHEVS
jgi:hypothetical protein